MDLRGRIVLLRVINLLCRLCFVRYISRLIICIISCSIRLGHCLIIILIIRVWGRLSRFRASFAGRAAGVGALRIACFKAGILCFREGRILWPSL